MHIEMTNTSDVVGLFTAKHGVYDRFIHLVGYPRGLRSFFEHSPLLRSGLRVLDAGCGTGAVTLALYEALVRRGIAPRAIDAFDLTPAMLNRFHDKLESRGIQLITTTQANVLQLDQLPRGWTEYDLIVSASMLEYIPRERLAEALAGLRSRLGQGGHFLLFITKRNWLTRPLVGWWWRSNLYDKAELLDAFKEAGFPEAEFRAFPPLAGHLATWGHIIEARTDV
jgi:ubiquinone/menaquinone biosynthesis C-methylase UbiE